MLAGGRSTRMGRPKANLEWHGSTLLHRVTGIVGRAVDGPVVVVRAPDQELPELPPGVRVVEDAAEGRGPLQGLAAGLAAVAGEAELAYVSSTDVPLLHPAFVSGGRARRDAARMWMWRCRWSTASGIRWRRRTGPRSLAAVEG